jgi:hypothetical protein
MSAILRCEDLICSKCHDPHKLITMAIQPKKGAIIQYFCLSCIRRKDNPYGNSQNLVCPLCRYPDRNFGIYFDKDNDVPLYLCMDCYKLKPAEKFEAFYEVENELN